jgi:soluble lytic murein transglycosylase-like protein
MRVVLLTFTLIAVDVPVWAQVIPRAALQYKRALIGNARLVWGLDAPVSLLASQVHQESGWNPNAKSAYANGLSQFTPSSSKWISELFPDLADNAPFEPSWALRAVSRFDRFLWERASYAADECSRASLMLSGYNGGEGWVARDRKLAASKGKDATKWFGNVELYSSRASWAFTENRRYVKRILKDIQPLYIKAGWGVGILC